MLISLVPRIHVWSFYDLLPVQSLTVKSSVLHELRLSRRVPTNYPSPVNYSFQALVFVEFHVLIFKILKLENLRCTRLSKTLLQLIREIIQPKAIQAQTVLEKN